MWIEARYDGRCGVCGGRFAKGDRVYWLVDQKTALCQTCGTRTQEQYELDMREAKQTDAGEPGACKTNFAAQLRGEA